MDKTILIAGKEMPEAGHLSDGIAQSGRRIVVTERLPDPEETSRKLTAAERKASMAAYEEEKSAEASQGICTIEWNKVSPLSARALVLQTITVFGSLDEAVLYFDEESFADRADRMDSAEVARGTDDMIIGYQYLALEILAHFQRRGNNEGAGTLVFLIKGCPSQFEILQSPELKTGTSPIASPLVAAGASAFSTFAENIACVYNGDPSVNVLLLRGGINDTEFRRDEETGRWVCSQLATLYEDRSHGVSRQVEWIRAGARAPISSGGGFSFLSRKRR